MDGLRKQVCLLVFLFVGSTSLWAQTSDPFPAVDTHKYADNMTIFGQVRQNGVALGSDAVVAVYCGDELRGKGRPFSSGRHTNIVYIQVYGETKGEALTFKVSSGGEVVEVDQSLTYQVNGEVGGPDNYYYIDLPSPYVRGDANGDGVVNVTDIMGIANIILKVDTNGSRAMREIDDAVEPQ